MARPKKSEEKAKEGATLSIDVDSFVRTRDSVSSSPSLHLPPPNTRSASGIKVLDMVVAGPSPLRPTSSSQHLNIITRNILEPIELHILTSTRPISTRI